MSMRLAGYKGDPIFSLLIEITQARAGVHLTEAGHEKLTDLVTEAIDGDLGHDVREALNLPESLKDLVSVQVRWAS